MSASRGRLAVSLALGGAALALAGLFLLAPPGQQAQGAGAGPRVTAGFQTTDRLVLTVQVPPAARAKGPLTVDLLGPGGRLLASKEVALKGDASDVRVEFPRLKVSADRVTVRCALAKKPVDVALKEVLFFKAHETTLAASAELFAGSQAGLRCEVHGVKSLTETVPLAGASVAVALQGPGGKEHALYAGKAGRDGAADVRFKVPELPAGTYKMVVTTRSDFGEEKLEREVKVKSSAKVLLTTDKPLYQPGQKMHLRALALRPFDLLPVAGAALTLEVEDAKGNKVFKKELKTSEFGIAAADFQLADEVNNGDYRVRAVLGEAQADKTVTVKPYVLPKFKAQLKADKSYYLPKETVRGELQVDYFFGKPVAGAKVKVTASTFDVAFKAFHTWEGKTDKNGFVKFTVKLPDSFVGLPLAKGNALVRLEAKVTDTADHTEAASRSFPVSDQPIRVSLLPEAGRLVPGLENRVFAAALYPDGSPAACTVRVWTGKAAKGKPFAEVKTNAAGLAEVKLTPQAEQFRAGAWGQRPVETLGGQVMTWAPNNLFDLHTEAKDDKGNAAKASVALASEPFGENVLLRLDKAIYKGGDTLDVDVRTSAGLPTAYVDVVKSGQVMLSKWLDVKGGKASAKVELPAALFGALEVHAYQMLSTGEILRDTRVVYVNPASDLKVEVKADKDVYLPGAEGTISFRVTDAAGKPAAAALGVLIVDEAVYALQEMQPGLEKVYFTLQEELLKPQAQAVYKPDEGLDTLVRRREVPAGRQQVAEVLLTAVKPKPALGWRVDPKVARRQKMQNQIAALGGALFRYALENAPVVVRDKKTGKWSFRDGLADDLVKAKHLTRAQLRDDAGGELTLEGLSRLEAGFTPEQLAKEVTLGRMQRLLHPLVAYTHADRAKFTKGDKWVLPEGVLADAAKHSRWAEVAAKDAWGRPLKVLKRDPKRPNNSGHPLLAEYEMVSAGPDGEFGTKDDLYYLPTVAWQQVFVWFLPGASRLGGANPWDPRGGIAFGAGGVDPDRLPRRRGLPGPAMPGGAFPDAKKGGEAVTYLAADKPGKGEAGGGAQPPRLREYFPETLLWHPELITGLDGRATLRVPFADSITTWRLTASASSRAGALGGVSAPLRVFQDFFVDLDLPLALTQHDEVAFPVAVYNYLKTPQKVTLDLKKEAWFDLVGDEGYRRTLELKPGEVTAVKFRVRAKQAGAHPLTVQAKGTKMSDAVKRVVAVEPDGQKVEQAFTDRLEGTVNQTVTIPESAVPDASKLFVKVYPGVFSQLLEGTEGMLRMPNGCFEQTSSAAYPNILVVDYMNKTRTGSPATRMKAEQYLNAGYQRLLTFERPGGGFDWWGRGEPLVWLSAYGLQEFNDMAKVWPVDKGVITRTRAYLFKQQAADGTWSKIGGTHGESIERMGDPKLLLTSYVTWALLDSADKTAAWKKSEEYKKLLKAVEYVRTEAPKADNAYILALAANALASWDATDDSTYGVLKKVLAKLDAKKEAKPDWKAVSFPTGGQSLAYARGDSLTVETTALATLAMIKSGQFTASVNQALTYLVKSKGAHGTWGSTQATILALKALLAGVGGVAHKGTVPFTISVNGKEAFTGAVTEKNADVLQQFDLKDHVKVGANKVTIEVKGKTGLMYQVVGRHYDPWTKKVAGPAKPVLEVDVKYDRTKLSTADLLKAKATLRYHGKVPTYQVIVDLGVPPGFTADAGDFAEMVAAKKVQRFSVTSRQVTLYLGDVKPGSEHSFEYSLKPKYPVKAKTPVTVAYEYYTPAHRAAAKPVELVVEEKK